MSAPRAGFGSGLVAFFYVTCAATTLSGGSFIMNRVRGLKEVEEEANVFFEILEKQCEEEEELAEAERNRRLVREFEKAFGKLPK